jgi:23S rRNA pseudouridine2605 synthase
MPEERIQKILAEVGVASRRASEALIAAGRVTVDGRIARLGDRADAGSAVIEVDGVPVGIGVAKAYVVLHKPAGVTSTTRDRHAATTVLDLVPTAFVPDGTRLYPVGRLDQDSEGLIILTNDGEWAEHVLHPRFGVEREYAIALAEPITEEQGAAIEAGVALEEGIARLARPLRPSSRDDVVQLAATLDPPAHPDLVWYRATLTQGWKRQLRRMFGATGAPILRLVRIRIGALRLAGLQSGRVRRLTAPEIKALLEGATTVAPPRKKRGSGERRSGHRRPRPASKPGTAGQPASASRPSPTSRHRET